MPALRYPNLADDPEVRDVVLRDWVPLINRTRRQRQVLNQQWLRYDNLWKARPDSQAYKGRSNVYLPVGRRVIENWVTKLKQDLFPASGQWWNIEALNQASEEGVSTIDALFKYYALDQMRLRRRLTPWLRTLVTIGTAPIDWGWRFSMEDVPLAESLLEGKPSVEKMRTMVRYLGPTVRAVPPWRWYIWPPTVSDVEDAELVFEDYLLDPREMASLGKTPIAGDEELGMQMENVEGEGGALSTLPKPGAGKGSQEKFDVQKRQLAARGLDSPANGQDDPHQALIMTKAYVREQFDDEPLPVWYQLQIASDEVVCQVRRVPFTNGLPTYDCGRFMEVEDEFYGWGVASAIDTLQYATNDTINQGNDALVWSLNPIVGIDPGMVQDWTTLRMKPAAKWLVRNPRQSIQALEISKDSAGAAAAAVQQNIALMNDTANVSPYGGAGTAGRSRGRALQTLGGMQLVASEALVQVSDVIQNIEDQVLNRGLRRWYDLTEQCLEEPLALRVEGARGAALIEKMITRDDVIGDYRLLWAGSTSSYNSQVRGAQMIQGGQFVARIPPEILAQQNVRFRWDNYLVDLFAIGLQLPNAPRYVERIQPVTAMDPMLENKLLAIGRVEDVKVSPADDDAKHEQVHAQLLADSRSDVLVQAAVQSHIEQHQRAHMAKMLMMEMQQQGLMPPGGQPGMPGQPGQMPGGPPPQNGGQPPMNGAGGGNSGAAAMAQQPGRLGMTSSVDDVMRQMPRSGGM